MRICNRHGKRRDGVAAISLCGEFGFSTQSHVQGFHDRKQRGIKRVRTIANRFVKRTACKTCAFSSFSHALRAGYRGKRVGHVVNFTRLERSRQIFPATSASDLRYVAISKSMIFSAISVTPFARPVASPWRCPGLATLVTATKQQHQLLPAQHVIEPITRPIGNAYFTHAFADQFGSPKSPSSSRPSRIKIRF